MSKPKYLYRVVKGELVLYSNNTGSITIQHGDPLGRQGQQDSMIHLDREDAAGVRDAIDQWLKESE